MDGPRSTESDVDELEVLTRPGHEEDLRTFLLLLHPADIAALLRDAGESTALAILRHLNPERAAELVSELDAADQERILSQVRPYELAPIVGSMETDDITDLLQELDEHTASAVLASLPSEERRNVTQLLRYAPTSAGGIMQTELVSVTVGVTVSEAIAAVRSHSQDVDILSVFVLDREGRYVGDLSLPDLVRAPADALVDTVMTTKVVDVTPDVAQGEVVKIFDRYSLVELAVVDQGGRLLGRITADDVHEVLVDIVDVAQEAATEDAQKFGGMEALDAPYLQEAFHRMVQKRAGWMAALFLGEMLTASAMAFFEEEISRAVILTLFIPLIISSGGNSGSQASTLVIRAMALGEVRLRDWWRVMRREVATGLVLGTVLGSIGFLRIVIWHALNSAYGQHYLLVALTIHLSLVGVVTFGTIAGSILPFILRRLGLDPASASAPFVATLVDVTGLVIYFSVAAVILHGTLL